MSEMGRGIVGSGEGEDSQNYDIDKRNGDSTDPESTGAGTQGDDSPETDSGSEDSLLDD